MLQQGQAWEMFCIVDTLATKSCMILFIQKVRLIGWTRGWLESWLYRGGPGPLWQDEKCS